MAEVNGRIDGCWKTLHQDDSKVPCGEFRFPNPWLYRVAQGNFPGKFALDIAFVLIDGTKSRGHVIWAKTVLSREAFNRQRRGRLLNSLKAGGSTIATSDGRPEQVSQPSGVFQGSSSLDRFLFHNKRVTPLLERFTNESSRQISLWGCRPIRFLLPI
jgi:hypothetical protein